MIRKYDGFILEKLKLEIFSLLEANSIYGTTDFLMKLKSLINQRGRVGQIAEQILDVIESGQWFQESNIKQNYFDLVDTEDTVGFINDTKVRDVSDHIEENPNYPYEISGRGEIKIGKVVNYICSLRNITVNDSDREAFVNAWKSSKNISTIKFKLVSGDDIVKYYNKKIYYKQTGTLGNSCMSEESSKIFKIYTENPDKVKLLVYLDDDDKVHGRALVWKVKKSPCESKYFMDRVYTNRDSDVNRFKEFANNEGWFYKKRMNSHIADNVLFVYKDQDVAGEVKLKLDADFRNYPYIDTMCFLSKDKNSLSNLSDKNCYILHSLYGDREGCDDCDGDIILSYNSGINNDKALCDECATGHKSLKDLGVETKWNRKVN
jgi:hypothetical protein